MIFARPTWFKVGISLVFWLYMLIIVDASNSRTLRKIEVVSVENSEQVHMEFDSEFLGEPVFKFKSGSLSLLLDLVKKDPQLTFKTISKSNPLIRDIQAIQASNRDFINLHIILKSSNNLDYPKIKRNGNNLTLILQNRFSKKPLLSSNSILMEEIENRVKNDSSFPSSFSKLSSTEELVSENLNNISPLQIDNWGETILTLVVSLIFVLLTIYLIAFLYNRFFSGRISSMKGKVRINQVSSYYVGPKQKVIVFDFNGRLFACGVTPSSINLIAELFDEDTHEILDSFDGEKINNKEKNDNNRKNFVDSLEPELGKTKKLPQSSSEYEGVFLKNNSKNKIKNSNSNKEFASSLPSRIKESDELLKNENLRSGNQKILDFATKLTNRLKMLKPIK